MGGIWGLGLGLGWSGVRGQWEAVGGGGGVPGACEREGDERHSLAVFFLSFLSSWTGCPLICRSYLVRD